MNLLRKIGESKAVKAIIHTSFGICIIAFLLTVLLTESRADFKNMIVLTVYYFIWITCTTYAKRKTINTEGVYHSGFVDFFTIVTLICIILAAFLYAGKFIVLVIGL